MGTDIPISREWVGVLCVGEGGARVCVWVMWDNFVRRWVVLGLVCFIYHNLIIFS